MKYAIVKCVNGNFSVASEWTDKDKAFTNFHPRPDSRFQSLGLYCGRGNCLFTDVPDKNSNGQGIYVSAYPVQCKNSFKASCEASDK